MQATGMKQAEYDWAVWRLEQHGVSCPRPEILVRGAIIGAVYWVDIVAKSDSEWFEGQMGLVLKDAVMCDPTPVNNERGYFQWKRAAALAPVNPWMVEWGSDKVSLFGDLAPSRKGAPKAPFGGGKAK
ncbi:hypothetical protein [Yoonia sp. SDW83-1]|uniref:hypothetical protein n=1 Tax=Yoonia sp. SDW83-1 TaxID=3366945 RepID=UPI00398C660E